MRMVQAGGGEFKKTKQRGRERLSSGVPKHTTGKLNLLSIFSQNLQICSICKLKRKQWAFPYATCSHT